VSSNLTLGALLPVNEISSEIGGMIQNHFQAEDDDKLSRTNTPDTDGFPFAPLSRILVFSVYPKE
jgi:hypothetical protein